MDETISMEEALERIVQTLEEINVPVKYALQIARPLNEAVGRLYDCIAALKEPERQEDPEAEG